MTVATVVSVSARLLLTTTLATLLGALAASDASAAARGRPPTPRANIAILFNGTFSDARWGGNVVVVVGPDGRTVMSVSGIAPGPCDDEDYGHLLPGRDGATGPVFEAFGGARISANGVFALKERHSGQRRPFKPTASVSISGVFDGDVVRGTVRASRTTPFDSCTANARFTARRVNG